MSQTEILAEAERLVRETFSTDRKQRLDEKTLKAVAEKIARSVPAVEKRAA